MKRSVLLLSVVLSVLGGLLASCSSKTPVPQQGPDSLWNATLIPCTLPICGGFQQNIATLRLEAGEVLVASSGTVTVRLHGLTVATGAVAANKTLEVILGSFTSGVFESSPRIGLLGTVTTDTQGNFDGAIRTSSGAPFAFASGTTVSGQFVLNEPGVRTEFVTGFIIP